MIEYIKGTLISKKPTSIIVESNLVAYNIIITLSAYEKLPDLNQEVTIITHLHIKENPLSFLLLGFGDERERECFKQIISVSGIGSKTAMTLLSAVQYKELTELIIKNDIQPLTAVPGIGKKTAERIVLELKDKLTKPETLIPTKIAAQDGETKKLSEVVGALISLGYNKTEIDKMIKKISSSDKWNSMSVEEIIKEILRG